jgi:hypothetical protein
MADNFTRRKALTIVAAFPAAAALASPALAVEEDAELKRLWNNGKLNMSDGLSRQST